MKHPAACHLAEGMSAGIQQSLAFFWRFRMGMPFLSCPGNLSLLLKPYWTFKKGLSNYQLFQSALD
ncbi:MAG: hypothetical protein FWH15_07440 [Betaproteobacteria bacterium]|nr:hypothetical protein [Betaproteobacteria bacterium]